MSKAKEGDIITVEYYGDTHKDVKVVKQDKTLMVDLPDPDGLIDLQFVEIL